MTITRIRVQTMNQPSSYFAFEIDASAEALAGVLGWNPTGSALTEVLEDLRAGKVRDVTSSQVPRDKGTECVAYTLSPVEAVSDDEARAVVVIRVRRSTVCPDTEGAVDADIQIDGEACSVTLFPDESQSTVGRRVQLGVCGTPLAVWADDAAARMIFAGDEYDRDLVGEIVASVQEAADDADLT